MVENIYISYRRNGLPDRLVIQEGEPYDNLPYNLAEMFSILVQDSGVNPALVIEEMKRRLKVEE